MNIKKYIRFSFVFIAFELMITFIVSLLNLMSISSGITSIVLLVLNALVFFILAFYNGKNSIKQGFLSGLIISLIFLVLMYLINGLLFGFTFSISTMIYYVLLIIIGIIGGSIGINKKVES